MSDSPSSRRKAWLVVAVLLAIAVGAALSFNRLLRREAPEELDFDSVRIEVRQVRDDIFVLQSTGVNFSAGNITVLVGAEGVLLVDTQYQQLGARNLSEIRAFTDKPVVHVINTHMHVDHVGGNEFFRWSANGPSPAGTVTVMAHENVLRRLMRPVAEGGRRREVWPTDTYGEYGEAERLLGFDGEAVRLLHQPHAHTDGDTFVDFMKADVISTGDVYHASRYPLIDRANGGSIAGIIAALDSLVELVAVSGTEPGATVIVPGHGPPSGETDVIAYRDMIVSIRNRIRFMMDQGMSLARIQAARPTMEYDARFGQESGVWTTAQFVEAIYLELSGTSSNQ